MAIDSVAQLALMLKAKKVFGNEGTFLSFPVTPRAYKKEQLEFFSQEDAAAAVRNLQAFSTLVNQIPSGEAWLPTEARFLWDVYEQVLNEANLASSTRTPKEETKFQKAIAYLKVPGENGLMQDSPVVTVHNQYKDAYHLAQQEFMEARVTGEAASDPAEKQRWHDVEEPAWRAKLKVLDDNWIVDGHKNKVKNARDTWVFLGAKSPISTWAEWKGRINPDLDTSTHATGAFSVFPSTFAPSNALEEGGWKSFKLSESEIIALIKEAPAELRTKLLAGRKPTSVKSMNLEFSSAVVKRPWFESECFRARFWQFADTEKVISDGGTPPSGECPAYVTAIVFARKVVVEHKKGKVKQQPGRKPHTALRFNAVVIGQARPKKRPARVLKGVQPRIVKGVRTQKGTTVVSATGTSPRPRKVDHRKKTPKGAKGVVTRKTVTKGGKVVVTRDHRKKASKGAKGVVTRKTVTKGGKVVVTRDHRKKASKVIVTPKSRTTTATKGKRTPRTKIVTHRRK